MNQEQNSDQTQVTVSRSYLYDQDTHGDGSDKVFVVVEPPLHFVIATLERRRGVATVISMRKQEVSRPFRIRSL